MTEIDPVIKLLRSYDEIRLTDDEFEPENRLTDELRALFPSLKARPLVTRLLNIIHTYVWREPEEWLMRGRQPPPGIRVTTLEQLRKAQHYGVACEKMLRAWAKTHGLTL